MIVFTRLVAHDCFAYRYLNFSFTAGIHSITGTNGASKSSLFATLLQGLYNKNPKVSKIERVNNTITQQPYEIEIYFEKDEVPYKVLNSRKAGSITIWKGGYTDKHKISLKRIPDNLKLIEEILGCDYAMACDLMYQSVRSSINLLETTTDGERKKFINRILRLDDLDYHLKRNEDKAKELGGKKGKIETLITQISRLEESFGELQEELEEKPVYVVEARIVTLNADRDELLGSKVRLTARLDQLKSELTTAEQNVEAAREYNAIKLQLAEMEQPVCTLEHAQSRLTEVSTTLATAQYELKSAQDLLARGEKARQDAEKAKDLLARLQELQQPEKSLEFVEDQLRRIHALCTSTSTLWHQVDQDIKELTAAAQKGLCPTCGHGVDRTAFDVRLAELKATQSGQTDLIEKCTNSTAKYEAMKHTWKKIHQLQSELNVIQANKDTEIDVPATEARVVEVTQKLVLAQQEKDELLTHINLHAARKTLEDKLQGMQVVADGVDVQQFEVKSKQAAADVFELTKKLKDVEEEIAETVRELKSIQEHNTQARIIRQLNAQVEDTNRKLQEELDIARSELAAAETRLELYKSWVGILGSKGYRVHKMDRFLRTLNRTMSVYADMISNGRIQCRFFIDSEGEIDFTVTDSNKSIDFEGWSDGEKARIRMACLFAVLELLETLGSVSFNVLCLDEIFGALDDEGKTGLFKVLNYLRHQNKALFTIAHSEIALDMVYDSQIKAVKQDDGTSIVIQE